MQSEPCAKVNSSSANGSFRKVGERIQLAAWTPSPHSLSRSSQPIRVRQFFRSGSSKLYDSAHFPGKSLLSISELTVYDYGVSPFPGKVWRVARRQQVCYSGGLACQFGGY